MINNDEELELLFSNSDADLCTSFFQSSRPVQRPFFREIPKEELALDEEEVLMQPITSWSKDLTNLPPISHSSLYKYLVEGIVNVDERSRGAMKFRGINYLKSIMWCQG